MGTIARFDLPFIRARYDIDTFVETGTGIGDSLAYAQPYFDDLLSCELDTQLVLGAATRFADTPKVRIFPCMSEAFLRQVCAILPQAVPVLFWLDAHFPGADYGSAGYGEQVDEETRLPLEAELRMILRHRLRKQDVILIDDARIWLDASFQNGNLPAHVRPYCPIARNIDFIHRMFGTTHEIVVLYEDEGYITLYPKERADG